MSKEESNNEPDRKLDKAINKGIKSAKDALAEKMIHMAHKESEQSTQETTFNVVFTGTFSKDEKTVIAAMAKFFKQGQEATKRLLKPGRVIKSFPDKGPADKLAKMLSGIGLTCKVEMEVTGEEEEEKSGLLAKAAFKLADSDTPTVRIPKISEVSPVQWAGGGIAVLAIVGLVVWLMLKPSVIEGESFATYEASVQKMLDRATDEQRETLRKSILLLIGGSNAYRTKEAFAGSERVASGVVYARVDGLTAEEIIQSAKEDLVNQREQYKQAIAEAKQTMDEAQGKVNALAKLNGKLTQLSISDEKFVWKTTVAPEMMLKLTNNSDEVLTKIFFQGYLHSGSGKLMVSEPFTYATAVGIRPGSYKYVTVTPSEKSPWAIPEARTNWRTVKFTATVENAVNNRGREIGKDLRPFKKIVDDEQTRISRLEKSLADIKF